MLNFTIAPMVEKTVALYDTVLQESEHGTSARNTVNM
jgi:hypothetical protein